MGTRRGGTLIHALEKRLREREREDRSGVARPLNLLYIALCGLASLPFLLAPKSSHPCSKRPRSMRVHGKRKETSQQTSKETNGRKSMLKTNQEKMPNGGKQTCEAHEEGNKHVIKQKGVSQEDKCMFKQSVHSSIGMEYGRHTDSCMNM